MPKSTENIYDEKGQYKGQRTVGQDEDLLAKDKLQDVTGLGALGEKNLKAKGVAPTPTPMPSASVGMPKREDYAPGLGGLGEFNRAMTAWKAKNDKSVSGGKSLGGGR
jgi:hypothetical protein